MIGKAGHHYCDHCGDFMNDKRGGWLTVNLHWGFGPFQVCSGCRHAQEAKTFEQAEKDREILRRKLSEEGLL